MRMKHTLFKTVFSIEIPRSSSTRASTKHPTLPVFAMCLQHQQHTLLPVIDEALIMALAARKVMNYIEKGGKKKTQNNFSACFFF